MRESAERCRALPPAEQQLPRYKADRKRLLKWGKSTGCPATMLRSMAVVAVSRGESRQEAARALGLAPSTVVRAVERYRERGREGLRDGRADNGQVKVDGRFLEGLSEVLLRTPEAYGWARPTWTRELLIRVMEARGHTRVSPATMGRALWRLGARLLAAKPIVLCPWPKRRRQRRLAELRRLEEDATAAQPVLHVDEVDIHLNPKVGRDWCLPGKRRVVVTPGNNTKRYVAGALDVTTRQLVWVEADRKDSHLFIALLWKLVRSYPRARKVHLVLDNAAIHKSRLTEKVVAQFSGRLVLHFLPPYCPEGNRIERVWLDVHANVTRNHTCRSMAALMRRVHDYLTARNQQCTASPLVPATSGLRAT